MNKKRQSTVVLLGSSELPTREAVERALEDLSKDLTWHEEHEIGPMYAASVGIGDRVIGLSLIAGPLEKDLYAQALELSGLPDEDRSAVEGHGSHARVVFMDEHGEASEPVVRMTDVYRVAARLCSLDGVAVLAPGSGVLVLGLEPGHVDETIESEVPPLDMWIAVEKLEDDRARSVGASVVGIPEVELIGVGILDPESVFHTMMDVLLYLRRIRREFVPGETIHVGSQPWEWLALKAEEGTVKLERVDPDADRSVRGAS